MNLVVHLGWMAREVHTLRSEHPRAYLIVVVDIRKFGHRFEIVFLTLPQQGQVVGLVDAKRNVHAEFDIGRLAIGEAFNEFLREEQFGTELRSNVNGLAVSKMVLFADLDVSFHEADLGLCRLEQPAVRVIRIIGVQVLNAVCSFLAPNDEGTRIVLI